MIGAIYYFGILEGQKTGCKYLNVGGTQPFLSDGLTRFKLGLGAEFILNFHQHKSISGSESMKILFLPGNLLRIILSCMSVRISCL